MNAPARIPAGPAWERYIPVVDQLRPGGTDAENRHRAGLLLLRDLAAKRQGTASEAACMVFAVIEEIAHGCALATMSPDQLDVIRLALIRLGTGARELEKVFGGADG